MKNLQRLGNFDYSFEPITKEEANEKIKELLQKCEKIESGFIKQKLSAIVLFEGWDCSGKSGIVKYLQMGFSPDVCKIFHIIKPPLHEHKSHYLYRFWQKLPNPGEIVILDRSWYGRVVSESQEGIVDKAMTLKAYQEILAFEETLINNGVKVIKIFLNFKRQEMRNRLIERIERNQIHKMTLNDFVTYHNYENYQEAFDLMLTETGRSQTPWKIINATERNRARIDSIEYILDELGNGILDEPNVVKNEIISKLMELFPDELIQNIKLRENIKMIYDNIDDCGVKQSLNNRFKLLDCK